jgi:lipoyl(octanoyl) transferase
LTSAKLQQLKLPASGGFRIEIVINVFPIQFNLKEPPPFPKKFEFLAHMAQRVVSVYNYLRVPYVTAWDWQKRLVANKMSGSEERDVMLMLEHPNVYTLGKGATMDHIVNNQNLEVHRIERGGQVTHHCPGQLVAYPLLDLRRPPFKQDLHWYLRQLEETVIRVLSLDYELDGVRRDERYTGVWVNDDKVCAIGLTARKWITFHGIALNVDCDLSGFQNIVPCGIDDPQLGVTNISKLIHPRTTSTNDARYYFMKRFEEVFDVQCSCVEGSEEPV